MSNVASWHLGGMRPYNDLDLGHETFCKVLTCERRIDKDNFASVSELLCSKPGAKIIAWRVRSQAGCSIAPTLPCAVVNATLLRWEKTCDDADPLRE